MYVAVLALQSRLELLSIMWIAAGRSLPIFFKCICTVRMGMVLFYWPSSESINDISFVCVRCCIDVEKKTFFPLCPSVVDN